MSAHTPGPWHAGTDFPWYVYCEDVTGSAVAAVSGEMFSTIRREQSEWRANARLIAAAPAMLAKLEQLAAECAECHGTGYAVLPFSGGVPSRARCPDCADIRSVIAKATQP